MNRLFTNKRLAVLLSAAMIISVFNPALPAIASEALSSDSLISEPNIEENETVSDDVSIPVDEIIGEEPVSDEIPEIEDTVLESVSPDGVSSCSISGDFGMPSAFLTKKKIVLNGMRRTVSDDTYLVFSNDGDYELTGLNSSSGLGISVNKVSYNGFPAYRLSFTSTSGTAKGNYAFNIIPKLKGKGTELKKVRLIVSVTKKNPAVKWKKNLVILSRSVKGDFALNSPTVEGVSVVPLSGNEKYKPKIPAGINVTLQNESTIKITAGQSLKPNKAYPVTLWLLYSDSTDVRAVKRKFSVKVTDNPATVKLKKIKDSSMDLSARSGTAFHFKPVVNNTGFVPYDVRFREKSLSSNYYIDKVYDPDTGEITDFYVRAYDGKKLTKGQQEYNFDISLKAPRMDAKTVNAVASFKAARKSSKIKLTFVNGNNLMINETLSDNHIAGTVELRVSGPKYSKIDISSIRDMTENSAFKAYWTVDEYAQAARVRIVVDKTKVTSGKNYNLIYSLKASGADADTMPTKITIKYKAA